MLCYFLYLALFTGSLHYSAVAGAFRCIGLTSSVVAHSFPVDPVGYHLRKTLKAAVPRLFNSLQSYFLGLRVTSVPYYRPCTQDGPFCASAVPSALDQDKGSCKDTAESCRLPVPSQPLSSAHIWVSPHRENCLLPFFLPSC